MHAEKRAGDNGNGALRQRIVINKLSSKSRRVAIVKTKNFARVQLLAANAHAVTADVISAENEALKKARPALWPYKRLHGCARNNAQRLAVQQLNISCLAPSQPSQ